MRKIQIGNETVELVNRNSFRGGTRWNWRIDGGAFGSEIGENWHVTPEAAITSAIRELSATPCLHGEAGFCVDCHDFE